MMVRITMKKDPLILIRNSQKPTRDDFEYYFLITFTIWSAVKQKLLNFLIMQGLMLMSIPKSPERKKYF